MWKFIPIYKNTIWGGTRIADMHSLSDTDANIGESWLLSGVDEMPSVVAEGPDRGMTIKQLIVRDGDSLLGLLNHKRYGDSFPLLIKLIDSLQNLSVQVHPDNETARSLGTGRGKTEMWYVLESKPGATLTVGLNRNITPDEFHSLSASGRITEVLNVAAANSGDVFFIPGGTIHSIGAGCLLVEVQQASDTTFRIYDYDRLDTDGRPRELHTELAARAASLAASSGEPVRYTAHPDIPVNVVRSPFFSTNVMSIEEQMVRDYSECDSFVVIIATEGSATVTGAHDAAVLTRGQLALIPASTDNVTIEPHGPFTAMEVYIKQ